MPVTHRRATRTTNLLERPFIEERRRLKIDPSARGERAVLKLMFDAMTAVAERWRVIKATALEPRQIAAVKVEIDQGQEAQIGLKPKTSRFATPTIYPAVLGFDLTGSTEIL